MMKQRFSYFNFNKLLKYHFWNLIYSPAFIILNVLYFLSPIYTILPFYFLMDKEIYYSSFYITIIFQIITFIYILFLSVKLFNEYKYNNCDVRCLGKKFSKQELFWSKYVFIIINTIINLCLLVIICCILLFSLQVDSNSIAALVVCNLIGLLINILFASPILILISLLLNKVWAGLLSLLIIIIGPTTSILSNTLLTNTSQCNNININQNDNSALVQYAKIYKFNEFNKELDFKYVYSLNLNTDTNLNLNDDIKNSINYVNYFNFLIPGNITIGLQEQIFSLISNLPNLNNYKNYTGSLTRIVPVNLAGISDFLSTNSKYLITNFIDNNLFAQDINSLQQTILDSINNLNLKFESIINDKLLLQGILNTLSLNPVWNINLLSINQIQFLYELLGLKDSTLFYSWYYKNSLKGRVGQIIDIIKSNYSNELGNLISYLWYSNDTYPNIFLFDFNQELLEFRNNLLNKYPINFNINNTLLASKNNLDFISNKLVVFKNSQVNLLLNNGIYKSIDSFAFNNIFPNIFNQADWINYLTNVQIPTVGLMQEVCNKLKTLNNNLFSLKLDNQYFNVDSFNQIFDLKLEPMNSGTIYNIVFELILTLMVFNFSYFLYKRKNF